MHGIIILLDIFFAGIWISSDWTSSNKTDSSTSWEEIALVTAMKDRTLFLEIAKRCLKKGAVI